MKKNILFFLILLISLRLFAEPKVPKYYFGESDKKEDAYVYISNDFMDCYEIQALSVSTPNFSYVLKFSKTSLLYDMSMCLMVYFKTEKQLDDFINTIHLSDLENEFVRIRKLMIEHDAIPNPTHVDWDKQTFDYKDKPKYIFYQVDGTLL